MQLNAVILMRLVLNLVKLNGLRLVMNKLNGFGLIRLYHLRLSDYFRLYFLNWKNYWLVSLRHFLRDLNWVLFYGFFRGWCNMLNINLFCLFWWLIDGKLVWSRCENSSSFVLSNFVGKWVFDRGWYLEMRTFGFYLRWSHVLQLLSCWK